MNAFSPSIHTLLLRELTPGKHVNLRFLMTAMAGQGTQIIDVLKETRENKPGGYILIMEGSIQLTHPMFGTMAGEDNEEVPTSQVAAELARSAMAVVSLGTCASFGGIPSGTEGVYLSNDLSVFVQLRWYW